MVSKFLNVAVVISSVIIFLNIIENTLCESLHEHLHFENLEIIAIDFYQVSNSIFLQIGVSHQIKKPLTLNKLLAQF